MRIPRRSWLLFLFLAWAPGFALAQEWDLAITKSGPEFAPADTDVIYAVSVTNAGPDDATTVTLTDVLPAGMTYVSLRQNNGPTFGCTPPAVGAGGSITCNFALLASGASADFSIVVHLPAGTPPGTFFTNQVTVSSAGGDINEENDAASATTSTPSNAADLGIFKTGPSVAGPDTDITYAVSVTNAGPFTATSVAIQDVLPGDLTFVSLVQDSGPMFTCMMPAGGSGGSVDCTRASLLAGASVAFTLVAHVPTGTPAGTTYSNFASVSSTEDRNVENDLAVVFTSISRVDLSLSKTAPATIIAGQNLSYVITLANAGPDPATTARFSDLLPPQTTFVSLTQNTGPTFNCSPPPVGSRGTVDCTVASLASGASAEFTLIVQVSDVYSGTNLDNTVTAASASFDSDGNNDSATASTVVSPADTDVAITKTGPASVIAGQDASYTIGIANIAANTAAAVSFTDAMPAQTTFVSLAQNSGPTFACNVPAVGANGLVVCSRPALAVGASASFTFVVSVPIAVAVGATLVNDVGASTSSNDTNPGNDTASVSTQVVSTRIFYSGFEQ